MQGHHSCGRGKAFSVLRFCNDMFSVSIIILSVCPEYRHQGYRSRILAIRESTQFGFGLSDITVGFFGLSATDTPCTGCVRAIYKQKGFPRHHRNPATPKKSNYRPLRVGSGLPETGSVWYSLRSHRPTGSAQLFRACTV